jgi:hypothetical protein
MLPGNLRYNQYVRPKITEIFEDPTLAKAIPDIIKTMFDHCGAENSGGGWDRSQRYCLECVQELVKEHMAPWLRWELQHRTHQISPPQTAFMVSD